MAGGHVTTFGWVASAFCLVPGRPNELQRVKRDTYCQVSGPDVGVEVETRNHLR